jgi:Cys-rich repeat protein
LAERNDYADVSEGRPETEIRALMSSSFTDGRDGAAALLSGAFAGLALISGVFAACTSTNGSDDGGRTSALHCETRESCQGGQICTQDKFCADCLSSGECLLKEECRIDADAGTQRCALRSGWGTQCVRNDQCPAGQWCVQGLCKASTQVRLCPSGINSECLPGERCNTINLVCEEDLGCSANADCSPGEVCNTGTHRCVPRCTAETEQDVCLGGEKCVNERCVQCASNSECGVGFFCDAAGKCAAQPRCYQDRDCRVPLVCHLPTGTCIDKPLPCSSDENCASDERCQVGTGKCIPRSCQPDRFEPNDDISTARATAPEPYLDLTLCSADVDVYAFNLSRGDRLGVNVDADPLAEDTFTTLVQDAMGRTVARGKLLTSFVASAPATYFVSISTTDIYQPYDAIFLLTRGVPCDDDFWEPNDLPGQATPVNLAGFVEGVICPQDFDYFFVAVPSEMGVRVSLVDYHSAFGLLRLCLVMEGMEFCSDDPSLPAVEAVAAQVAGRTVLARVTGGDPRIANSYTLRVEFW